MVATRVHFIEAGFTRHLEAVSLSGGRFKIIKFPATVAVIEHPREGVILFDTGYSQNFKEVTRHFPIRFYALITPVTVTPETTARAQLKRLGIKTDDVRHVVLSHFHADHIGGAGDFPKATYIYRSSGYGAVRDLGSWGALRAGFIQRLLPGDFVTRSRPLSDSDLGKPIPESFSCSPFNSGCDLFGDGSVIAVDLPGHAIGQLGVFVRDAAGQGYFLVADACWGRQGYMMGKPPNSVVKYIFSDWKAYLATLSQINKLYIKTPDVKIIPCHCDETFHEVSGRHV